MIQRRLALLGAGARRLAQLAALAEADFSVPLAARVLDVHTADLSADWHALESAQLMRGSGFAHDLVAQAARLSIPRPIARQLHLEIAAAAEALGAPPARIARHWLEGEAPARAAAQFMRGADVALAASQRKLEADLAEQAADCFRAAGDAAGEFAARERQQSSARYTLTLDLQVHGARRLLELATTPEQRGAALDAYAAALIEDFRHDEIAVAAHEAGAIARRAGDATRELSDARTEARALGWMKRSDEALQLVRHYLPQALDRLADAHGVRAVAEFGCTLMTCERYAEAASLFEQALRAAEALRDWGLCQECQTHMAWVHDYRGEIEKSVQCYEASEGYAERLGAERLPASISRSIMGRRLKELGRFDAALQLLEEVWHEQRRSPGVAVIAVTEADLAGLHLWLGQPARAMATLHEPAADAPPSMRRTYHLARAQIEHALGRPALADLRQALVWAEQESGIYHRLCVDCEMARVLPPDEGAALALAAIERSDAIGLALISWPLRAVASDAMRRAGRIAAALELARSCVDYFDQRAPFGLYPAEYWWIASQVFEAAGKGAAATAAQQRGVDWIRNVGLPCVPAAFRESFLHRNAVNRALLTTVTGQ